MVYLEWIKREYRERWGPLARSAPGDRPFINLAASGMQAGDAILGCYPDHLRLDAGPGEGWRDGADLMWGHAGLREQVARLYSLPSAENVLPVAGGSQALFLVFSALRQYGAKVVTVESPAYGPLFEIPRAMGFEVRAVNGGGVRVERPFLHVVSNPNNPSGAFMEPGEVRGLLARLPSWGRLLVDESFLSPAEGRLSAATLGDPRVIVVGGVTKPLGLGALRVGWMIAQGPDLELLREVWAQGFNIGSPLTESLAARVLGEVERHHGALAVLARRNLELVTERFVFPLQRRGLIVCPPPSRGCIAFPRVVGITEAGDRRGAGERFYRQLLEEYRVAVVPGRWFDPSGEDAFVDRVRISFSGATETVRAGVDRLVQAIEAFR